MEEKNKNKNGRGVAIIFVIGVLIIALVCCLTYILNINKELGTDVITGVEEPKRATEISENSTVQENKDSNIKDETEKNNDSIDILEINSIIEKLDIIDGLEFSNASKLSNEKIYNKLNFYLYKTGVSEDTAEKEIKEMVKNLFNIEYDGNLKLDYSKYIYADGEAERIPSILGIEKDDEEYVVTYALINNIDGDTSDEVWSYYDAEIVENEDGSLYVKSNKLNKTMSKNQE